MILKRQISSAKHHLSRELIRRGENFKDSEFIESFGLLHPAEASMFFAEVPEEVDEGITGQKDSEGVDIERAISITELRCIDLLCEGEVEGLVTSEYVGSGTSGNIGYDTVKEKVFAEIGIKGEVLGSGLKWLKSIKWNDVPLINGLNKLNYQQIDLTFSPGTNIGGVSDGLSTPLTVNRPVGERLRGGGDTGDEFAKVYRIENSRCKGIGATVKVNQLMYTEKVNTDDYGDIRDTSVTYYIYYRPIWNIENKAEENYVLGASETVTGRASTPYLKQSNITFGNVPNISEEGHVGWEIKFVRETAESLDTGLRNQTFVDSFFEVYGDVFKYPNSCCVQTRFSAEFFSSIPDRKFDLRGTLVNIPADYNPITKKYGQTYEGIANPYWKGNFKNERVWTDNPAWCFYDILTNKRYGLGKYIESHFIDKWTLYEIAKYCDTMVPDGYGGQEPRFTCDMAIQSRDEAYKVVNDMASIFRAVTYFSGGTIHASQDSEKDTLAVFTNASVENGNFTYSSSARKARHTVAIVKYKDKRNNYENAVEYIEDVDGIRKFGIREIEMAGVGVTSRGQAHRYGKWALLSEQSNVDTVNFSTGIEGSTLRPGDIIGISDSNKYTKRYGGRTISIQPTMISYHDYVVGGTEIKFDQKLNLTQNGTYKITLLTPTYQYDTSLVDQSTGAVDDVGTIDSRDYSDIRRSHLQSFEFVESEVSTGSDGFSVLTKYEGGLLNTTDYEIPDHMVWMIEPTGSTASLQGEASKKIKDFKVLNISEKEPNIYSVYALEYLRSKFAAIDGTADFDDDITSPPTNPPAAVLLSLELISSNTKKIKYQIIPATDQSNVLSYLVYIKFGSDWNESDFDSEYGVPSNPPPPTGTPIDRYLVGSHPRDDLDGEYIPQENGKYYVRVYSGNRIGSPSTYGTNAEDTEGNFYIEVAGINPILDTMIHALTITGEDFSAGDATDLAGTRIEVQHDLAEPVFVWKVSINGESPAVIYDYKITIREPSNSNIPSSTVLYTTTLEDRLPQQLSWEFELQTHIRELSTLSRDYDVTVEAIDRSGASSAGTFTPGAGYSNTNGYDIVNVKNPDIGYIPLTEYDSVSECEDSDAVWCSDQWLTPDGDVKLLFGRGPNSLNAAMGVLWISAVESSITNATDAQLLSDSYLNANSIRRVDFYNNSNNPMGVDISMVNFTDDTTAYISVAFGDGVDKVLLAESLNRGRPDIHPAIGLVKHRSNVVKVVSRGDFVANYGTGFFRKYISGFWEGGVGGGIKITHNYGINAIYSTAKYPHRDHNTEPNAYEPRMDGRHPTTQLDGGRTHLTDYMFLKTPYGVKSSHYSGHRATYRKTAHYAHCYLVTYVFQFDRAMPNNEYHVVFIPGLTTYGDNLDRSLFTEIVEVKVGGLSAGNIKPTELTDGQTGVGTWSSTHGAGQYSSFPVGMYTRHYQHGYVPYSGDMKGRKAVIYKAPEGFAIKIQTSDYNTGNFTNRPIYIGIVSAT
jgi:hypothetical protein